MTTDEIDTFTALCRLKCSNLNSVVDLVMLPNYPKRLKSEILRGIFTGSHKLCVCYSKHAMKI